jgi:hypothetical protein
VNGFVRPRRAEGGDVQASRAGGIDARLDDGDVLAVYERDDVGGHDLARDIDGKEPEGCDVLRRHDPNVAPGNGDDRPGSDTTFAFGQRGYDYGTLSSAVGEQRLRRERGRFGASRHRGTERKRAESQGKGGGGCELHRSSIRDLRPMSQRFSNQCERGPWGRPARPSGSVTTTKSARRMAGREG